MQKNAIVDITINANLTRFLIRAVLFTVFCLISLVVFSEFNSANVDQVKVKLIKTILPLFWVATIFTWYQYIKLKKHTLTITAEKITWGSDNKAICIAWSRIHTLSIINLAEVSSRSGLVYEFTIKGVKTSFERPLTLFGKDYSISHNQLLEIFQWQAQQHNFTLKL